MDSAYLYQHIIADMMEGVLTVDFEGIIESVNASCGQILGRSPEDLVGMPFMGEFIFDERNDDFCQIVVDAIAANGKMQQRVVDYYPSLEGDEVKHLRIQSSVLHDADGSTVGMIIVVSDITELYELRDAVKAMEKIRALNSKLEMRNKLLQETFGRYLSDEIVETILKSPDGLAMGGRDRDITVMMSDLRGFTAMCERLKPEETVSMLNHYFGLMNDCIEKYNGTVIEFLGDGIFVVFGAPNASDHHAADAVAAAIAMQRTMVEVNEWNSERGYPTLSMGIGINSGSAIIGNIGCEKRTKYGAMGSQINLAGRIESYTTGGQILISPYTRERIKDELVIEQEATVAPKGVDGTIVITQVVGIRGRYDELYEPVREPLIPLSTRYTTTYRKLDGKHVSDEAEICTLFAISSEQLMIRSRHPLEVFDNIRLDLAGETYGKCMKKTGKGLLIDITAAGDGYALWLEAMEEENRGGK